MLAHSLNPLRLAVVSLFSLKQLKQDIKIHNDLDTAIGFYPQNNGLGLLHFMDGADRSF